MLPTIAAILLLAAGQLDPGAGGALPGYDPGTWKPPQLVSPLADPAGPYEYHRIYSAEDALAWTILDLKMRQTKDPHCGLFLRYVWIPPHGDVTWIESNSFVVNSACNHSSLIHLPEVGQAGWLLCWDLRKLAPKHDDLRRLAIVWDALAINDPYFHAKLPKVLGVQVTAKCRPYVHIDGKTYQQRVFVPAPHLEEKYAYLENETQCFAPLVRADDFLRRMSSTIEGGLYYHAIGFICNGHRLTEAEIFKLVGLDVLLSRKVEGDDRAALFQSSVTGKPRTVEQVQGAVGKARITYDLTDSDNDASRHALYNLLNAVDKSKAKEIIFERSNGTFGYLLTDGKGALVDVAPPDVASDSRVPDPHTKQLFPMLSCIRCHGAVGGVQVVRNDVRKLLSGGFGAIDIYDDFSSKNPDRLSNTERVAGLFLAGDKFESDLFDSRNRYADSVFLATRGSGIRGDENVVEKASANFSNQISTYWYGKSPIKGNMDADQAALEWGYRVKAGEGHYVLRQLIPASRTDIILDNSPIEFSDPALGALKMNMTIRRQDYERIHSLGAYVISKNTKGGAQ